MTLSPARLPPPVVPGDRVGVAALSGPVDPRRLDAGLEALRGMGLRPVEAGNCRNCEGLFAGTEGERLAGLYGLADDPSIKAIFFSRGGWGVNRLLPEVDWQRLGRYPRAYIGYSDLTPFLHQIVSRLGLVAFHGPMVAADLARGLSDSEEASLWAALGGDLPVHMPLERVEASPVVEGILLGGCLSLIVSLVGTPWEMDLEGALVFTEDLNEPPYRLDRMLTHLRLSGTLTAIRGLIVGHLHASGRREPTAAGGELTLDHVLRDLAKDFPWPLARGLGAGHAEPNWTLPLGLRARLDPTKRRLSVGIA